MGLNLKNNNCIKGFIQQRCVTYIVFKKATLFDMYYSNINFFIK